MKSRFTSADVTAMVISLREKYSPITLEVISLLTWLRILGMRVANVYDVSGKTYLLKLSGDNKKVFLLLDSGISFHTTTLYREKSTIPSVFSLKLRKHIRTKRLENIEQVGIDRIVIFTFGVGTNAQHLILELFASGNIILTDSNYQIQTLLRTHKYEEDVVVATKQIYPLQVAKQFSTITLEQLTAALNAANPDDVLKQVLTQKTDLGAILVEHVLLELGMSADTKVSEFDKSNTERLLKEMNEYMKLLDWKSKEVPKGYILLKSAEKKAKKQQKAQPKKKQKRKKEDKGIVISDAPSAADTPDTPPDASTSDAKAEDKSEDKAENKSEEGSESTATSGNEVVLYDEFVPFLCNQYKKRKYIEFATFDEAVAEFFSKVETQKIEAQRIAQESAAMGKLEKVKTDQMRRIEELQKSEQLNTHKAQLIECNLSDIDQAIKIIRSGIAEGMDWNYLAKLVKEEKKKGDPIASIIHKLKLDSNEISLLLTNNLEDQTEAEMSSPAVIVDIDLSLSAHGNARRYYEMKKQSAIKAEKTKGAAEVAIAAAEKKAKTAVQEVQAKARVQHVRKTFWFEKFYWFISSDGYLVIGGRDAQQNEMLFKRYMKKGDIYVHADLHGAPTCIIKNPSGQAVPVNTLQQAGMMSVCRSVAWNEKVVTSAWWVYDHQVSKTAPTGEYLTTGSFMIRGKKNFLAPGALVLGFGFYFKLHESSISNHLHEHSLRSVSEEEDSPALDRKSIDDKDDNELSDSDDEPNTDDKESDSNTADTSATATTATSASTESTSETKPTAPAPTDDKETEKLRSFGFGITSSMGDDDDEDEEEEAQPSTETQKPKKKKLTVKQRKLLKKGIDPESLPPSQPKPQSSQEPAKVKQKPLPRGKKGKLKKMKEKYAEQDEEERKLRMELLGSVKKERQVEQEKKVEAAPPKEAKKCFNCGKEGHLSFSCPHKKTEQPSTPSTTTSTTPAESAATGESEPSTASEDKAAAAHDGTSQDEKRQQRRLRKDEEKRSKEKEAEEIKQIMEEENIHELDDEEKEKLSEIDSLTGMPLPDDVLLFAVPVCAPYQAISHLKYKVKLTPGNLKKGKAAKTAVNLFMHSPQTTAQEKELLKCVTDTEIAQQMVGNVKIQTPGLLKHQQKMRKQKQKK